MNTGVVVKASYCVILLCAIGGAYLRSVKANGPFELLVAAAAASLVFIVVAIYEVNNSKRINSSEKTRWIIGFLFMSTLTGFFYLVSSRKRVMAKQ